VATLDLQVHAARDNLPAIAQWESTKPSSAIDTA
jgi:hypothetical protein